MVIQCVYHSNTKVFLDVFWTSTMVIHHIWAFTTVTLWYFLKYVGVHLSLNYSEHALLYNSYHGILMLLDK